MDRDIRLALLGDHEAAKRLTERYELASLPVLWRTSKVLWGPKHCLCALQGMRIGDLSNGRRRGRYHFADLFCGA